MPAPAPQKGAPQQGQQQGPSPAEQAVQMIEQGYQMLGKIMQASGGQLPPQTMKLFQTAAQATDALLEDLTGPDQGQGGPQQDQQNPGPSGPMAANANSGAKPAGPQG